MNLSKFKLFGVGAFLNELDESFVNNATTITQIQVGDGTTRKQLEARAGQLLQAGEGEKLGFVQEVDLAKGGNALVWTQRNQQTRNYQQLHGSLK